MSIQDWAAIAEIVGAFAVVASLVYLAVQIRQNTHELSMSLKATELAAFERNVDAGNRIREIFILNPDVSDLFARGKNSYEDLDNNDKVRFAMLLSNVFSAFQGAYIRQLTYGNDPENFAGSKRLLDSYICCSGVRDWLRSSNPDWRPEFAALVQERVNMFDGVADEASAKGQANQG